MGFRDFNLQCWRASADKKRYRERGKVQPCNVAADVEQFLAKGGAIQQVASAICQPCKPSVRGLC